MGTRYAALLIVSSALLWSTNDAHAVLVSPEEEKARLTLDPAYPEPGQTFTVLLDAYTVDTSGAVITWYQNDIEIPGTQNSRKISLTLGELGEPMNIKVTVRPARSASFTLERSITPGIVDLVMEASAYTPPFYRGKALAITQAPVRIIAIPHDGTSRNPRLYTYLWKVNGNVILGGSILGKDRIEYTLPRYEGARISVTVTDSAGRPVGEKTMIFNAVKPELHFYEESPLRGLGEAALKRTFALVGDETTIHGEPYFLSKDSSMNDLSFAWSINGAVVENDDIDPHTLTVRKTGESGTASVELLAQMLGNTGQYVQKEFTLSF